MSGTRREEDEHFIAAMQLCYSSIFSKMVKTAFELGVFDILAMAGPNAQLTAFEIAGNFPGCCSREKAATMLDHIMGYLATHSLLTCSAFLSVGEGRSWKQYGLTPVTRLLAENNEGASLAPYMRMTTHKDLGDCWDHLKETTQKGVNVFKKAHGVTFFEFMTNNPSLSKVFNQSMACTSNILMEKIVEEYDGLKKLTDLVDIGGGVGASLKKITSKYPHIKGINFDLPDVISQAPSLPGVQHVGGDMFTMIPSGGAILLKWILHDWNDEKCLIILKNCWRALPTSGKAIIVEQILPEFPEENIATQCVYTLNVIMAVFFDDAKERTEKEYRSLAQEAGFSEFKILCKVLNFHVMELVK